MDRPSALPGSDALAPAAVPRPPSSDRSHASSARRRRPPLQPAQARVRASPAGRLIRHLLDAGVPLAAVLALLAGLLAAVKWAAGVGGHSGFRQPPLHGDFEAQRHWLELTLHVPVREWYWYDLPYWGLDYPPLTALHSLALGKLAHALAPAWVALGASRGCETAGVRAFLRAAALLSEAAVLWPAAYLWVAPSSSVAAASRRTQRETLLALVLFLGNPALALVDGAHFQFNGVMLGLAVLAAWAMREGREGLGCAAFVGALGFKQIALYWAPAVGVFLLAKCWHLGREAGTRLFAKLALVTSLAFASLFAPFFLAGYGAPSPAGGGGVQGWAGGVQGVAQVGRRVFPFARGLFEDKVANFWCATNVVVKWRTLVPASALPALALALTALLLLPVLVPFVDCVARLPGPGGERWGRDGVGGRALGGLLRASAMAFFLGAFQVHEKAILLPLLGSLLELTNRPREGLTAERVGWLCLWVNVSCFSMYPLLERDGAAVPYAVLPALYTWAVGGLAWVPALWARVPGGGGAEGREGKRAAAAEEEGQEGKAVSGWLVWCSAATYSSILLLHVLSAAFPPPPSKPDLHTVLNVLFSFAWFVGVWAWSVGEGLRVGWGLVGVGQGGGEVPRKEK